MLREHHSPIRKQDGYVGYVTIRYGIVTSLHLISSFLRNRFLPEMEILAEFRCRGGFAPAMLAINYYQRQVFDLLSNCCDPELIDLGEDREILEHARVTLEQLPELWAFSRKSMEIQNCNILFAWKTIDSPVCRILDENEFLYVFFLREPRLVALGRVVFNKRIAC